MTPPAVSVVVATRDRGAAVLRAACAILDAGLDDIEVIVADQSEAPTARDVLAPLLADGRLRYLPVSGRGVSAGRNAAVRAARARLVAVTDDDCEPVPGWLTPLRAALDADPRVGLAFGSVEAAPHDRAVGTIPAFVLAEAFVATDRRDPRLFRGLGPGFLFRCAVWQTVAGFDQALGAGARFRAGELPDFVLRAMRAGHAVACMPDARVIHHGFRTWLEARTLLQHYCYGGGALWAKHIRWPDRRPVRSLLDLGGRWIAGPSPVSATLAQRSDRRLRLAWFARGFLAGLCTPIDRASGHYAGGAPI